jgi:hypothetical protein
MLNEPFGSSPDCEGSASSVVVGFDVGRRPIFANWANRHMIRIHARVHERSAYHRPHHKIGCCTMQETPVIHMADSCSHLSRSRDAW